MSQVNPEDTLPFPSGMDGIRDRITAMLGDHLFCSIVSSITKTNIGTSYVNIFPAFYDGVPIPIDTKGYTKIGIVLLWNKNGGTGRHDVRLINNNGANEVFVSSEAMPSGLPSGRTKNYDITIPEDFTNFRGELRLQGKSTVATDSPIFDGLWIYLIR
jgi:hypothetical protein